MNNSSTEKDRIKLKKIINKALDEQEQLFSFWLKSLPQATLSSPNNLLIGPRTEDQDTSIQWLEQHKVA